MSRGQNRDTNEPEAAVGRGSGEPLARPKPTVLESTLPPTPLRDLLAAHGASIFVLSVDQTLIDTVQQAASEQYPVLPVATWQQLVRGVEEGRCGIALLDLESLGDTLEKRIASLREMAPVLVILLASRREEAQALIGLLSERKIHRLLIKPPAPGITRLLIESAVTRYLELRERADQESVQSEPDAPRARALTGWPTWLIATVLVSLALGAFIMSGRTLSPQRAVHVTAPPGTAVPVQDLESSAAVASEGAHDGRAAIVDSQDAALAPAPSDPFAAVLREAEQAIGEGRVAEPPDDNALDRYLAILEIDPAHVGAVQGMDAVAEALFGQIEGALLDENLERAAALLAHARRAQPESPRLVFLEAQLERSKAHAAEVQAQAQELQSRVDTPLAASAAPPSGELASLLAIARSRLQRGQVLSPAGDSALAYVQRAAALAPQDPAVTELAAEVTLALGTSAQVLLGLGRVDEAEALLQQGRSLGVENAALAEVELAVAAAREEEQRLQEAALLARGLDRLASGQLVDPPADGALHHLGALWRLNSAYPGLADAWQVLIAGIEGHVREAVAREDWAEAERTLAALRDSGGDTASAVALEREVAVARRQSELLQNWVPAAELELIEAPSPEYPEAAWRSGIEGWVELEYVVGRDGRTRDIQVLASDPVGRFEGAAVAAVSGYRYAPPAIDGVTYERLARIRIRFALQ